MTPTAQQMRGGPTKVHTPATIIERLRRYEALYGPGSAIAAAFSPSSAKWAGRLELADRYFAGDPETGEAWPSLNAIKSRFDGSFNRAREAAGLPANKPGPANRRPAGTAAPVRDVRHETRVIYRERDSGAVERERARADRAEARLTRAQDRIAVLERAPKTTKTTKVVDRTALDAARARAAEARDIAKRMAAKLERAEATITTLREHKRELDAQLTLATRIAEAAKADVKTVEVVREVKVPVERVVQRPGVGEDVLEAARADVATARADTRVARDRERAANARADRADRAYMDLVEAVDGQRRRLTAAELAELRTTGPAGPAVFTDALKRLARARRDGGRDVLAQALTRVAAAAVSWRERL